MPFVHLGARLAACAVLLGTTAGSLGAQQPRTPAPSLRALAKTLTPVARAYADTFFTKLAKGDSTRAYTLQFVPGSADWETRDRYKLSTPFPRIPARRLGVKESYQRILPTDHPAARFYLAALKAETNPWVVRTMLSRMGFHPLLVQHQPFEDYLVQLIGTSTDSAVTWTAMEELGLLHGTRQFKQIGSRILATYTATGAVPTWQLRAYQRAYEAWLGTKIPAFLHDPPPVFAGVPGNPSTIRVLAFGDWGTGTPKQYAVAAAMRAYHARAPFTFGITLGDNFYNTDKDRVPQSPRDPRWQRDYEAQYGVMGVPFYVASGNHDYFEAPEVLLAEYAYGITSPTWRMPALHYTYTAGPAQFFVLDLGEGTLMSPVQAEWLDRELAKSTARWKVVYAHFPGYEANNYMTDVVQEVVVPLLKKHKVDLYLNGHFHALEHWEVDGTDYVTSGNGGGINYKINEVSDPRMKYGKTIPGFSVLDIDATTLTHRFVDADGQTLYEFTRRK